MSQQYAREVPRRQSTLARTVPSSTRVRRPVRTVEPPQPPPASTGTDAAKVPAILALDTRSGATFGDLVALVREGEARAVPADAPVRGWTRSEGELVRLAVVEAAVAGLPALPDGPTVAVKPDPAPPSPVDLLNHAAFGAAARLQRP